MTYTLGTNATMAERVRFGETIPVEDIADTLEHYAALVATLDGLGLTSDNPMELENELEALQKASTHLDTLLDVTCCETPLEIELKFEKLDRYKDVCKDFDIADTSALREALQTLDDYVKGE